ncbi:MAG: S8 family serine peptidase, partial [Candidatus Nanohaloarchaea archaeon]
SRYNTTLGPGGTSKNTITVGAVDDTGEMTSFSSWGPTDDGRIKPTIVADGGCGDDTLIRSSLTGNTYGGKCGTSMAAPAVSGAVMLLNQQYNNTYGFFPNPATLKATLIHTATDINRTGPDYITGWGLVNTTAAVEYINESKGRNLIKKGEINDVDDTESYTVELPQEEEVRFTLVWMDYPGSFSSKDLKNDLNLVINNNNSQRKYPWSLDWQSRTQNASKNQEDHKNTVEQVHISATDTNEYNITINATVLPQGPQDYSLLMTTKDLESTALDVSAESPLNQTYAETPDYNLSANKSLVEALYSIDGSSNYSMQERDSNYFYNLTADINDGQSTATFWGKDGLGDWSSDSVSFTLDSTNPTVNPQSPNQNSNISKVFQINATWTDATTGVEKHNFTISNSTYAEIGTLNSTFDSSTLSDGDYTLYYNATDGAGNEKVEQRDFKSDNTGPEISVIQPSNESNQSGSFNLNFTKKDITTGIRDFNGTLENSSGQQEDSFTFNTTLDTSDYSDGSYTVLLEAEDFVGNYIEKIINLEFDNTPPNITVQSPTNNSRLKTPFDIKANWSSEVKSANFTVSNKTGNQLARPLNYTVNEQELGPGSYNITYQAWDHHENLKEKRLEVEADVAPQIDVLSPENRTYADTPDFNVSSDQEIDSATVDINGSERGMTEKNSTYYYNDSIGLNGGNYNPTLRINDTLGLENTEQKSFTIDDTSPNVNIRSPVSQANISGAFDVNVTWSDEGIGVETTNVTFENASGVQEYFSGNKTIDSTLYSDGEYFLNFTANDSAGNQIEESINIEFDNSNPSLQIKNPEDNSNISQSLWANATWSDEETGVKRSNYSLANSTFSNSGILNTTIELNNLDDGDYNLSFNVSDYAGNNNARNISVTIDTEPPQLLSYSPGDSDYFNENFNINATWEDKTTGVSSAIFKLENSTLQVSGGLNNTYDASTLNSGFYNLSYIIKDYTGNNYSKKVEISVDRENPSLNVLKPENNSFVNETDDIEASWGDELSSVSTANFSIENQTASFNGTLNSSLNQYELAEGSYNITYSAFDQLGNKNYSRIEVSLDNQDPSINISSPNSEVQTGSFYFNYTASDDKGILSSNYTVENGTVVDEGSPNSSINSEDFSDGGYDLIARVQDKAGNSNQAVFATVFDNEAPKIVESTVEDEGNLSEQFDVDISFYDAREVNSSSFRFLNQSGNVTKWQQLNYSDFDAANLDEGEYNLSIKVNDSTGNQATRRITGITLDKTPPQIELKEFNMTEEYLGWANNSKKVEASCNDTRTGVQYLESDEESKSSTPVN